MENTDTAALEQAVAQTTQLGSLEIMVNAALLAVAALTAVSLWRVFAKAGKPGWSALIPIYNLWVMLQIAGRPGWWIVLFAIPGINLIIAFVVFNALARSFGRGLGFAVGLTLAGFLFFPILAFGSDVYTPPSPTA